MSNQSPSPAPRQGTQLNEETFKDAVRTYIELYDEIQKCTKDMRSLKKQKVSISDQILEFMDRHKIDEFKVPDGKLMKKLSKRQESLKRDYVVHCLNQQLGEEKAQAIFKAMNDQRKITAADVLLRTRNGQTTAD